MNVHVYADQDPNSNDEFAVLSTKPMVVAISHLDEMCTSCQGFTLRGESGSVKMQGSYREARGFVTDEISPPSFQTVLNVAHDMIEFLTTFLEAGAASYISELKETIDLTNSKLVDLYIKLNTLEDVDLGSVDEDEIANVKKQIEYEEAKLSRYHGYLEALSAVLTSDQQREVRQILELT